MNYSNFTFRVHFYKSLTFLPFVCGHLHPFAEVLQFVEKNFSNQFKDIQSSLIQNHHDSDPLVVAQIVQFMSDRIMQYKPTHLTLSLLTYASQFICEWLCFYFKLHYYFKSLFYLYILLHFFLSFYFF